MDPTFLWIIAVVLMIVGFAGIVLPGLPGVPLMFGGMLLAAYIDDFQRVGWITLTVLGLLTVITVGVDIAATALGAKRVGASKPAIWGAIIGTALGMFFGLVGLIIGPFVGAVAGELHAHGNPGQAGRAGFGTWMGLIFGTLVKVAIAFSMLGIFVFAFLL